MQQALGIGPGWVNASFAEDCQAGIAIDRNDKPPLDRQMHF